LSGIKTIDESRNKKTMTIPGFHTRVCKEIKQDFSLYSKPWAWINVQNLWCCSANSFADKSRSSAECQASCMRRGARRENIRNVLRGGYGKGDKETR